MCRDIVTILEVRSLVTDSQIYINSVKLEKMKITYGENKYI